MSFITGAFYKDVLTILLVIITSVYLYYKWSLSYWKRKGVESVPASFPFGSAAPILQRKTTFGGLLQQVYEKYKPKNLRYVGFYMFSMPILIPLDIELIKTIITKDFHHFTDHGNYINEEDEPLTATLFGLKGQKWKHLRGKLTPTFTSGKMKMMFQTLVECTHGLNDVMDDLARRKEVVDIKDVAARYTTDVIGSCAFGLDYNSLKDPNSEFRQFGKKLFDSTIQESFVRTLALVAPNLVATLKLKFINPKVADFFMDAVKKTINYREGNNVKRNDFMHLLIQLKNNVQLKDDEHLDQLKSDRKSTSADGLTVEQIAAQALIFFIGGFETSSTTLTFCLYELCRHPHVQNKLREEIREVLKKHDGNITYDVLTEMTYMEKCVQESLRKYPPLPLLFRECTEDYVIPDTNVLIKKGTQLFVPILGVHFDPEFYPNPQEFDPERFSAENIEKRHHFAWLPFGEGPRACIGLRFGLMQIKVALTVLLRDYEFSLNNKTETPLVMGTHSITMTAKGGVWLDVKKLA